MNIRLLHKVRDNKKLKDIEDSMLKNGWIGNPVLVIDMGEYYQAITGTHRIQAAINTDTEIESYIIEPGTTSDNDMDGLWEDLIEADDDEERLQALIELYEHDFVEKDVVKIMKDEIKNNEMEWE